MSSLWFWVITVWAVAMAGVLLADAHRGRGDTALPPDLAAELPPGSAYEHPGSTVIAVPIPDDHSEALALIPEQLLRSVGWATLAPTICQVIDNHPRHRD